MKAFEDALNTAPVMSMFISKEECLKARELHFFQAGMLRAAEIVEDCGSHNYKPGAWEQQALFRCAEAIRKEAENGST